MRAERPGRFGAPFLPRLGCALAGVLLWAVFSPALMSGDSIDQYDQALTGRYHDWHPPVMSLILAGVLKCGGSFEALMLAQCLAGCLGVYELLQAGLGLFAPDRDSQSGWVAFALFLGLLCPLSPLPFYLMTFTKDAWAAILLSWIVLFCLRLARPELPPPRFAASAGLLAALVAGFFLVRHNGVVLAPALFAYLAPVLRWRGLSPAWAALLALSPVAASVGATAALDHAFAVHHLHPGKQILALDLVGLCVLDEGARPSVPYTSSHLNEAVFRSRYRFGDVAPLFWEAPPVITPGLVGDRWRPEEGDLARLKYEYLRAAVRHPVTLARVKWRAFRQLLGIDHTTLWVLPVLIDNPFGLRLNERCAVPRRGLVALSERVVSHRLLRWVGGVHLVWLGVNLAGLLGGWLAYRRYESRSGLVGALVLLLPLSYYLSYLLAAPAVEFRMMYPATLVVQAVTLAWAAVAFGVRRAPRRAEADG